MEKVKVPDEVKHDWQPDAERGKGAYECPACHTWTSNLPLYRDEVCEARDRRKGPEDRRQNR